MIVFSRPPIYVLDALRTPVGKLGGALSHYRPDNLAATLLQGLLQQAQLDAASIDGIFLGCANQAGEDNRNVARMVSLLAGLPTTATALTVNSLCSSGLEAILAAARCIALGEGDCYLAGGVETMSRAPWVRHRQTDEVVDSTIGWRFANPDLPPEYPPLSMSATAERVAHHYKLSREALDAYAQQSRARYQTALENGWWDQELLPLLDAQGGTWVQRDESHRLLTAALLQKMPPLVEGGQYITAGNAARVGDGAAMVIVASEAGLQRWGGVPLAHLVDWQSAGWHPNHMSYSAVAAVQQLLKRHPVPAADWAAIHWSESFALQPLLGIQELALPTERVNPRGGALSIGNPIAVGAARDVVSLSFHLTQETGYGMAVTAGGLGTGAALLMKTL